jgi:SAM-dependent methyltransferase
MKSVNKFHRIVITIGLLSAATLIFETALTRFLAVAQFYHFAFLVVSLALLGFGASGTLLSIFPRIKDEPLDRILSRVGIGFVISIWITYMVVNWLPFDSYSIAWERKQILYFLLYYFFISLPFLVSGLGLGTALAVIDQKHNYIYAANLVGSGLGVLLTPLILGLSGLLGAILLAGLLGMGCWLLMMKDIFKPQLKGFGSIFILILGIAAWITLLILNVQGKSFLGINISPYKGLAYARRFPEAELLFGKWNASSRIDVMANAGIRKLPGLSYAYNGEIPIQHGLSIDGDMLQPITLSSPEDFSPGAWLPESWALSLQSLPEVLVLEPGAGFGILQVLAASPGSVTTVVQNQLILESVLETAQDYSVYHHPGVEVEFGNPRAFLSGGNRLFDLIFLPLTDSYQPVTNGVYSISEEYSLTEEAFGEVFEALAPGGILVSSRWLQNPPSEGLRLVSTIYSALDKLDVPDPEAAFVIYRGIQTITVVVKPDGWEVAELNSLRDFLERCRFDLVWAPDLDPAETNLWNQLPDPFYFQEIQELFSSLDKSVYFDKYPFDITPPRDNHPFFFHFFTWSQAPLILSSLGKTWQPFGGSGFLLLIFLLVLVILLSFLMILIPLWFARKHQGEPMTRVRSWILTYFGLIGIGFMFLEIPLISQWGLFLDTPLQAFSLVVGVLLVSSGLGSMTFSDHRLQKPWLYPLLLLGGGLFILFSILRVDLILSWPLWIRYLAPILGLSPLGFGMGYFFPQGISWIKKSSPGLVPWAWAVNGSASVFASVLTAILFLQWGYSLVLLLGGIIYLGAWSISRICIS